MNERKKSIASEKIYSLSRMEIKLSSDKQIHMILNIKTYYSP